MRIAICGGGLFGCTAAIFLARAGHETHLFETKKDLVLGATASTYCRIHRGPHYPRHVLTGRESRRAEKSFRAEYGSCVIDGGKQLYKVADGGHISVSEFRQFLADEGLYFSEEDGLFQVEEPRIHLADLSTLVRRKVRDAGVVVHLNSRLPSDARRQFDHIVVAAYSGLNEVLAGLGCTPTEYKFQVVERPVVKLPESFRDTSIVVIDGPFGCIDPMDGTQFHILGHVVHTVHASNVGFWPEVPEHLVPLIDRWLIPDPPVTCFREAVDDLAQYIPGVEKAEHWWSSFTVRAVLAHQEATDKRPTLVQPLDDQVTTVFSGKLSTATVAAQRIVDIVGGIEKSAEPIAA